MSTHVTYTLTDYDGERGTMGVNLIPIAADGSNYATIMTNVTGLQSATANITRGAQAQYQVSNIVRQTNAQATDAEAQREEKWLVTYEDTTEYLDDPTNTIENPGFGKLFNVEIPCADLSLRIDNSEIVYTPNMASPPAAIDAWVTLFESTGKSPYGGDASVLEIRSVGRNT